MCGLEVQAVDSRDCSACALDRKETITTVTCAAQDCVLCNLSTSLLKLKHLKVLFLQVQRIYATGTFDQTMILCSLLLLYVNFQSAAVIPTYNALTAFKAP